MFHWVILAFVPSGLMLATTTFLTTDIVAMPMLWVLPLGLYLLSFSVAFREGDTIPDLLANRTPGHALRAWVPGCSTGEEAYSLAMVFKEAAERFKPKGNFTLQIFATDLDQDAIDKARQELRLAADRGGWVLRSLSQATKVCAIAPTRAA